MRAVIFLAVTTCSIATVAVDVVPYSMQSPQAIIVNAFCLPHQPNNYTTACKICDEYCPCCSKARQPVPEANKKKVYHIVTHLKANFYKAIDLCGREDMMLATFNTEAEFNELVKMMKSQPGPDKTLGYWLSGQDLGEKDRWIWVSNGKPLNYTKWAEGQPDHTDYKTEVEHCIEVRPEYDHKMNDLGCFREQYFVCET